LVGPTGADSYQGIAWLEKNLNMFRVLIEFPGDLADFSLIIFKVEKPIVCSHFHNVAHLKGQNSRFKTNKSI
jgi:hypothetical protein